VVTVTDTENVSESRAARKEAQSITGVLRNQLANVEAAINGRHFGDDEQGKIDALAGSVEAAKAVQDSAASLVEALERALAAKQG
jgi:hypothetical protein